MLRKIVNVLIVVPLALIFIVFAVANRHLVTVSFDPFNSSDPSVGLTLPLFVVIVSVAILGVVAGGVATWFGQRRWRAAARRNEAEAQEARAQLANLHDRFAEAARTQAGQAPQALISGPVSGPFGRDKQGAAL
ncbi:MAG: lipopolysaccharide assembly protein LapA domain-containing protein [Pseudomonadota bacterium]